jgi:acetyl-CoA carboxylase biotin carboxyl carrier protein
MNSLQEYGEIFHKLNLTELTVQEGDKKLCLKRNSAPFSEQQSAVKMTLNKPEERQKAENADVPSKEHRADEGIIVRAPLLGMFKSQVSVGDKVKKGDVLCMIEAMKAMNEVVSPTDGIVSEVLAGDGELVEFEQKLLVIS